MLRIGTVNQIVRIGTTEQNPLRRDSSRPMSAVPGSEHFHAKRDGDIFGHV